MSFKFRLREGTIIRILAFYLYKFIFVLIAFLLITLFNPIISKIIEIPLRVTIVNLIYFVGISYLIDGAKFLVFQGMNCLILDYEKGYFLIDRFLRIFLDTGNNTLYLFIGSILHYLIFLIYVSFFDGFPNEMIENYKHFWLILGFCISVNFLIKEENFEWVNLITNKFTALKDILKKSLFNTFKFSCFVTILYHLYTTVFIADNKKLFIIFTQENLFFQLSIFVVEHINTISYYIMKIWICAPIKFNKKGLENLIKEKIPDYNRFVTIHYYQTLLYNFEKILYIEKENSFEKNFLCSAESINEMHLKFSNLNSLVEKYEMLKNKRSKMKNNLLISIVEKLSTSMNFDIFNKFTSFEIIDIITRLLCSYIKILSKGEVKKYSEILRIFESLIDFESFLFALNSKDRYFNLLKKNEKFRLEFEKCLNSVSLKVDEINSLIVSKKLIPSFGEKVKMRIKEFILAI